MRGFFEVCLLIICHDNGWDYFILLHAAHTALKEAIDGFKGDVADYFNQIYYPLPTTGRPVFPGGWMMTPLP